ncbi:hypothetical protein MVEN_00635400 [Mycena venus]|uniref:Uncharacterized protein n=1 Tax=Mycena venus TaxID=2733690 RepID=A0A8H6YR64_9AGAR|nr:hypothetical protein MVEN_00635400 [Mycena venus]
MPIFSFTSHVQITGGNFVDIGGDFNLESIQPPEGADIEGVLMGMQFGMGEELGYFLITRAKAQVVNWSVRRELNEVELQGCFLTIFRTGGKFCLSQIIHIPCPAFLHCHHPSPNIHMDNIRNEEHPWTIRYPTTRTPAKACTLWITAQ